jgi:C_GCAxxG_C_C family probable redox protein
MMLAVGGHFLGNLDRRSVEMTTGFAGGVGGSSQELCGALSGGVMVIGGLYGRNSLEEDDSRALDLATRYRQRFLAELGETRCGPLRERVHAPGGFGSCAVVVERAARILLELVSD